MKILTLSEYKILADADATKLYYKSAKVSDSQVQRNLALYCEQLPAEEKHFFDSFGIDPAKCEIRSSGFAGGHIDFEGYYLAAGYITEVPKDSRQDGFYRSMSVKVGAFTVELIPSDRFSKHYPIDIPEGFFCIDVKYERMPRLLSDAYESTSFSFEYLTKAEKKKVFGADYASRIEDFLKENGIKACKLTQKEYKVYINKWFDVLTYDCIEPYDAEKLRQKCHQGSAQLWNVFFMIVNAFCNHDADRNFDKRCKGACTLVSTADNCAYIIEDGSRLTADLLSGFRNVTIIADDFLWVYARPFDIMTDSYYWDDRMK